MTLAFLNVGTPEMMMLFILLVLILIAIGHYGRNTILGYWGSILVAVLTTPIGAVILISILRSRKRTMVQSR